MILLCNNVAQNDHNLCTESFVSYLTHNGGDSYTRVKFDFVPSLHGLNDDSLKVPGPIFQNGDIYSNDVSSPKKS